MKSYLLIFVVFKWLFPFGAPVAQSIDRFLCVGTHWLRESVAWFGELRTQRHAIFIECHCTGTTDGSRQCLIIFIVKYVLHQAC